MTERAKRGNVLVQMNPEFCTKALEKVGSTNMLVNILSQRVRQLSGGSKPMLIGVEKLGYADIALREIIEGKLTWTEAEFKNEAPIYTVNLRRKRRA